MEKSNTEILTRAAALLDAPGTHCRDFTAINSTGDPVDPEDPAAVSWCAIGAIERAVHDLGLGSDERWCALIELSCVLRVQAAGGAAPWNDSPNTSREDVRRALLDAAAAA